MNEFLQALSSGQVLLMDGAMGTELQRAGARAGECVEHWNLTHPEKVRAVHHAYARAGAKVVLTNTFQANPVNLKKHGLLKKGAALCRSAIELARSAPGVHWVLGDIGPMADSPAFPRQPLLQMARWLAGVDAILLETCSDGSALQAVSWLNEKHPALPVLLSLSFRRDPAGRICTWDGHGPEHFAEAAVKLRVAALGVNCGADMDMPRLIEVVRRWRSMTDLPLFARPNAGTPRQVRGRWVYPGKPKPMAALVPELLQAGATMIGGCCGTTPAHIAAFRHKQDS